jgi:hypothetical protein
MTTTHASEVRAEMPSGMVPPRELACRSRYLHKGSTCTYKSTGVHPTNHSCISDMRGESHLGDYRTSISVTSNK